VPLVSCGSSRREHFIERRLLRLFDVDNSHAVLACCYIGVMCGDGDISGFRKFSGCRNSTLALGKKTRILKMRDIQDLHAIIIYHESIAELDSNAAWIFESGRPDCGVNTGFKGSFRSTTTKPALHRM